MSQILVVEDEAAIAELISLNLRHAGYEVTIAANGDVSLKCVADDEPPPPPPPPPPGQGKLVINEVDYDQVGTDADGFVEIHSTGDAAADLSNVERVAVNGGDSAEYAREQLTGTLTGGGYVAVAIELQNGAPDGLALLEGATLLDALSYEGAITAATIGGQTYNLVEGTGLPTTVEDSNAVERLQAGDDGPGIALRPRRPGRTRGPRIALLAFLAGDVPAHRFLAAAALGWVGDLSQPSSRRVLAGVDHGRRFALAKRGAGERDRDRTAQQQNRLHGPPSVVDGEGDTRAGGARLGHARESTHFRREAVTR